MCKTILHLVVATWLLLETRGFVIPNNIHRHKLVSLTSSSSSFSSLVLQAKKKNRATDSPPKGFAPPAPPTPEKAPSARRSASSPTTAAAPADSVMEASSGDGYNPSPFLTSLPGALGGSTSTSIPTMIDESIPVEQRTSQLLRDKYGLRTLKEQQEELKRQELIQAQRKKLADWKKMADDGDDFDIIKVLPGPVLLGIDTFLKFGLGICGILFVLAGLGITVEAWSKTTKSELPVALDQFIVTIIEPNFTTGLIVLLGFSISLGLFATAQLSSASSTYRSDRK